MKKPSIFLITILSMFLFAACSKAATDEPPELIEDEDSHEQTVYTYPFTGLETNVEPTNRAIAVMVNNQKQARPQSGLHEADIVFEILAEGDVTRFLALF